jgi:N-acetylmuramic acid 6-phosphate etherase
LLQQPRFATRIAERIREDFPNAGMERLEREAVWGAIALVARIAEAGGDAIKAADPEFYLPTFRPEDSPTEQRNPASRNLDQLTPGQIVQLMLEEEKVVVPALEDVIAEIERAASAASRALRAGGRIFYVGAGTSGRLGVLDASECPPTFRAAPELVQGIIAGGQRALWQAVEGAEDDPAAGANAVRSRGVSARDIVIGIAASGRTPFVWGALQQARKLRAKTVLICFNPSLGIAPKHRPNIVIAASVGPEILTGSTRLKSGTATKLILNMISTIAMIRLGKVASNLMIDVNASNVKLRDRAARILSQLSNADMEIARRALERNGWVIRKAWEQIRKKPSSRKNRQP